MNIVYKEAICGSCELLSGVDEEVLRKIILSVCWYYRYVSRDLKIQDTEH
jgi:hypothetical protein